MVATIKHIINNRFIQHFLFWSVGYFILVNIFSQSSEIYKIDYIYTALFVATLSIGVYIHLYILIPELLAKKIYPMYAILFVCNLALCSLINYLLFEKLIDYILPGYYFISYYEFYHIVLFFVAFMGVSGLLKLSKSWFLLMQVEKEKTQNELKALKAQVNPHFFFNSMQSIYSLTIDHSELAPGAILKLSDIMRYMIYDTEVEKISLEKEIELVKNYIDLQKLRLSLKDKIEMKVMGKIGDQKIAPMLLLPLVENAYKHGLKAEISNCFINIDIIVEGDKFEFNIENNKGEVDEVETSKYKGIGLTNVKRQLNLIYPQQHTFTMQKTENTYTVDLKINL